MNTKKYNWILYLITSTIVITIAVQLYWNYNNYLDNKQRVNNEIQNSLDIAIDEYYSNISKSNFFAFIKGDSLSSEKKIFKEFWSEDKEPSKSNLKISSISVQTNNLDKYRDMPAILDSIFLKDSLLTAHFHNEDIQSNKSPIRIIRGKRETDSLKVLKGIRSVVIALTNDKINFTKLDSIFNNQLSKKGIQTTHHLMLLEEDSIVGKSKDLNSTPLPLFVNSKSTFLRPDQSLRAYYEDPTIVTLKKSSTGILLSLLLSLTVISSLFYLLRIIKRQKELAEIKNDLISNITHEFKTPIATVSTAIEAIESFNVIEDKEKTKKYLSMSSVQLKKLHQMVEKLLETATLDSENLILQKESIDVVELTSRIVKKLQLLTDKNINFSTNVDSKLFTIDLFHFENAISNLIDNAIKYGGNNIEININSILNSTEVSVADDGNGIEKNQQERIFNQFYRIPKGNRHDVKGFGIGLYYTKKIVEKHQGVISIQSNTGNTIFKISLPNE